MSIDPRRLKQHLSRFHRESFERIVLRGAWESAAKNADGSLIATLPPLADVPALPEEIGVDCKKLLGSLSLFDQQAGVDVTCTPARIILSSPGYPGMVELLRLSAHAVASGIDPLLAADLMARAQAEGSPLREPLEQDWKDDLVPVAVSAAWIGAVVSAGKLGQSHEVLLECGPQGSAIRVPIHPLKEAGGGHFHTPIPYTTTRPYRLTFPGPSFLAVLAIVARSGTPVHFIIAGDRGPLLICQQGYRYLLQAVEGRRTLIDFS